jgi:arylsulfatase A-like enzyme
MVSAFRPVRDNMSGMVAVSRRLSPASGKALRPLLLVVVVSVAALPGCSKPELSVVYDLARRAPVAEQWSEREVLLFGAPAAEPQLPEGFYREAGTGGEPFLWAKREAEVALRLSAVGPRAAVVDMAPFRGVKDQSVEVLLNATPVTRFRLSDIRSRYLVPLPAAAQRVGENRLRFVFAGTATPAERDPKSLDRRQLAAAFYSLTLGAESDPALDDLLGRDAPRPFSVAPVDGAPTLTLVGPALVRFALRLPARAELRFTPSLPLAARAAAGAAAFRVTCESAEGGGRSVELWSRVLRGNDPPLREVRLRLPGRQGEIVRLSLLVGAASGDRFAWGEWRAPRIVGVRDPATSAAHRKEEEARADGLRRQLAHANVLFVILDAARAREFGAYGYPRATTPEIDRIARDGVLFEDAYTPAVYTLGAMSSVWTSQYPDRHHGNVSFSSPLPRDRLTLADVLSGQGIYTAGFVATAVAGGFNGFDRGFEEFHEVWRERGSRADVFREVLPPWLARHADQRFFAYVHFREPHFPYNPPPPFDTKFGPDAPISKAARGDRDFFRDVNQGRIPFSQEERQHLVRLYDGNLAYVDQEVGALRRALEANGLWDRTLVIVAADHGEGLGEHGWIGHNVEVYEPFAHIPLVLHFPAGRFPHGVRVKGLVDLLDIAPTIADVFGALDAPGVRTEFEGRSLLPMLLGAPGKPLVLSRTVWDRPRYALRDGHFTYTYESATGKEHLFDTRQDPGETVDLSGREPLRTAYFRETLHEWTRSMFKPGRSHPEAAPPTMTPEQCENLKSLGYLGADTRCEGR